MPCTRSDGDLLTCKLSSSLELCLVRFVFSKEEEESVKIMFTCISFVPCVFFCMQLLFDMFSTLMSLEVRLN